MKGRKGTEAEVRGRRTGNGDRYAEVVPLDLLDGLGGAGIKPLVRDGVTVGEAHAARVTMVAGGEIFLP